MSFLAKTFFVIIISKLLARTQNCYPYGVHISLGNYYSTFDEPTTNFEYMKIMFFSTSYCDQAYIIVNSSARLNETHNQLIYFQIAQGTNKTYEITDNSGGSLNITEIYIYTFKLISSTLLPPRIRYDYTIYANDSSNTKRSFYFILPIKNNTAQSKVLITGMMDISDESSISYQYLNYFAQNNSNELIDAIIYTGDMAFKIEDNLYQKGLDFFKAIESFAAYIPFMPTAGIRDNSNNYSFYTDMIGTPFEEIHSDHFYTFNLGPAHFIQINTAYFFANNDDFSDLIYSWLEKDLKIASSQAYRKLRPWVFVFGYRSFYCSNSSDSYCTGSASRASELERLFSKYNVDLYISASNLPVYERLKPLKLKSVYSFSSLLASDSDFRYMVNPKEIIYIVDASAGNKLFYGPNSTSDLQSYDRGYYSLRTAGWQSIGVMLINTSTRIDFEQIETYDYKKTILDRFSLINNLQKWTDPWPNEDKITFITAFLVFVIIGSLILIIFMMSLES